MNFWSHRDIFVWFRRAWVCFRSHRDISRWSRRRGQLARSQCCIDPHYCQLRKFHEFRLLHKFLHLSDLRWQLWGYLHLTFELCLASLIAGVFCCRNHVIMADGWSCSSRVSKISSTDEIIFLVDTLWPVRTFRFLASYPDMKIDAINPSKIQIKTSRNSRLSRSIRF